MATQNPFADLIPAKKDASKNAVRPPAAQPANPFADLIPRGDAKTKRTLKGTTVSKDGSQNPFADLIPQQDPAAPQESNIAHKGDMRPGSSMMNAPDIRSTFNQGALANFSDEINAAAATPIEAARSGLSWGEQYDQNLAAERAQLAATRERYPVAAPISDVAGALSTAVIPAGSAVKGAQLGSKAPALVRYLVSGKGLIPMAARGATTGAAYGAVAGAGAGEGGQDRLDKSIEGAESGAALGALAPGAGRLAGTGYRLVRAGARAVAAPVRLLARPTTTAAAKVGEAFARDQMGTGRAASRLTEAQARTPEAVLADVGGTNTDRLLRAALDVPSNARQGALRGLRNRLEGTRGRLVTYISRAFGDPATFHQTVTQLAQGRSQNAAPLFQRAFATGTPWTRQLQDILQRPIMRRLVADAEEAAANRGEQFKSVFAKIAPDGSVQFTRVPDTEALHRIKVQIDTAIRAIKQRKPTSLGNIDVRDLTRLKQEFVGAIQNKPYKDALREFAGDSAFMNAIDEGYEKGLKMEPEQITAALSKLSPGEADMWRIGFGRALAEKMRPGVVGANRAERMYSPEILDRVQRVFRNDRERQQFMQALQMERRMFKTNNAAVGNSATGGRIVENQEAGVEAEKLREAADLGDVGRKLASGRFVEAAIKWVGRAKNRATGLTPETADQIIKLLTTRDPAKVMYAQQLIDHATQKLQRGQARPGQISRGVNAAVFSSIPSLARQ